MKFKLWSWEYEFDKSDAEVVFPLILLLLGLAFTPLNKAWLWVGGVVYYMLFFFLRPSVLGVMGIVSRLRHWWVFRCPHCKSREVILQGYQEYGGDELYAYHCCNECKQTSVLVNDRLLKVH